MNPIQKWAMAVRAPFFTGIIIPVLFGATLAFYETGHFNWATFFVTLFGAVFAHAAANMTNDYFDHKSTDDEINENYTPFSGGSRVIQKKIMSPKGVLAGAFIHWFLALACGVYLTLVTPGYWVLVLAAAGFIGGFFYTAGRFAFSYHGIGEIMIHINFGILPVMGAYFVQTGHFSWAAFWTSFPIGFLITAILYINQYPDFDADKAVGKNNLVVKQGKKMSTAGYYFLIFGSYGGVVLSVVFGILSPYSLVALLSLPIALKTVRTFAREYDKIKELIPAMAGTIQTHLLVGVLMSVGCIAGGLL